MPTYLYKPLLRPASFSTLPNGLKWDYFTIPAELASKRPDKKVSNLAYGVIETDRELTSEEIERFDLKPLATHL